MDGRGTIQLVRYDINVLPKWWKISCQQLLPCTDVLELHVLSAKHEFGERESLAQFQSEVNLEGHGWMLDDDNDKLDITWMRSNAARDEATLQVLFSPQNNF